MMRLLYLLILLVITSSFAFTIKNEYINNKLGDVINLMDESKSRYIVNGDNTKESSQENTTECEEFINNVLDCSVIIVKDKISEEDCDRFYTNECQSLLKYDKKACGNKIEYAFDTYMTPTKFTCAKDENGNYCPQIKFGTNETDILGICKSKTCYEKALEDLDKMKEVFTIAIEEESFFDPVIVDEIDKYIRLLNEDDRCINNNTSSFILIGGIIIGSIIVIIIIIFVVFILIKKNKSKKYNKSNEEKNENNLNSSETSSGRVIFLNNPPNSGNNVTNNNNHNNDVLQNPPPSYSESNYNNNESSIRNSMSIEEKIELPPQYTKINESNKSEIILKKK